MPRLSRYVTAPTFRHFWPTVPNFADIHFSPPARAPKTRLRIDMRRYLIQGAYPVDPAVISKADNCTALQFQGGYRCTLKITSNPSSGKLIISDDGLCFEYTANVAYTGKDSFSYRIVNVMGQYSAHGYINLFIRC